MVQLLRRSGRERALSSRGDDLAIKDSSGRARTATAVFAVAVFA
jgi:hypothetical protein